MIKLFPQVKENKLIADKIYQMDLEGDFPLNKFVPGKFVHIKCGSGYEMPLRRPISICDIDDQGKVLTILYRVEGAGTKYMSELKANDKLDLLGPLGEGFPISDVSEEQTALMIGGGIGVPPLYYLAKQLKAKGVTIKSILGFNSKKDIFLEEEFKALGDCHITTVDGSHGHQGFVTHVLEAAGNWDKMYSCGPTPMLKALQSAIPENNSGTAYMSLEERMGCGLGACLACYCEPSKPQPNDKGYRKACSDGPVFGLHEIKL